MCLSFYFLTNSLYEGLVDLVVSFVVVVQYELWHGKVQPVELFPRWLPLLVKPAYSLGMLLYRLLHHLPDGAVGPESAEGQQPGHGDSEGRRDPLGIHVRGQLAHVAPPHPRQAGWLPGRGQAEGKGELRVGEDLRRAVELTSSGYAGN